MSSPRPLIGIPADRRQLGHHPFHVVGEKYITAVLQCADAMPLLIPSLGDALEQALLLDRLDGLLFPGSPSNVEPHHYDGEPSEPGTLHDPHRDATTLPLITRAVSMAVPVLGICRGFQEMNVAFGGTLHQRVREVPGLAVHHEDPDAPLDDQYGPSHPVALAPGGWLQAYAGGALTLPVNSLHHQGVDRLAPGLVVEATAPDGLIEAFRVRDAARFAVAVQWHPEWKAVENPFARNLFSAFGAAARERAQARPGR
jgi:putative glutamine amidotransferase